MTTYQVRVETAALAPASLLASGKAVGRAGEPDGGVTMEEISGNANNAAKVKAVGATTGGVVPMTEIRNLPIGPLNSTTVNPEEKRKIIGDVFIRVAEETWSEMKLDPDEFLLCQGAQLIFNNHDGPPCPNKTRLK